MKVLITFVLLAILSTAWCQDDTPPEVGKIMPTYRLTNIKYYKKKTASFHDFRGKWLFVGYWFSGCRTCITSLPKWNEFQKKFKNEMQVLLIGCSNPEICYGDGLEETYDDLSKKLKFEMISAFDSVLVKKWGWYAFPRIIIVDPNGIVRVVTDGRDLTEEKIGLLLDGKPVPFFDPNEPPKPFIEGETMLRSVLRKWNGEKEGSARTIKDHLRSFGNGYRASRINLNELYNIAYTGSSRWFLRRDSLYGEYAFKPLVETKDSLLFNADFTSGEGYFYYDLELNRQQTVEEIMKIIQHNLKSSFGFNVTVEERTHPVWRLVATDEGRKKLATKGGKNYYSDKTGAGGVAGFTLRNVSPGFFMSLITKYINEHQYPYFDDTGITSNIDITIDALLTDFNDLQRELNRNGLNLVLSEKIMHTLIIRD